MKQDLSSVASFIEEDTVPIELRDNALIHTTAQSAGGQESSSKPVESLQQQDEDEDLSPVLKGLKLDVAQPWERSLLRLLQDGQKLHKLKAAAKTRPVAELMLLGHTESRDYALEIEQHDDIVRSSVLSYTNIKDNNNSPRNNSIYRSRVVCTRSLIDEYCDDDETVSMSGISHKLRNFASINDNRSAAQQQQVLEARGEQDGSDRGDNISKNNNNVRLVDGGKRSFPILKASAISEDVSMIYKHLDYDVELVLHDSDEGLPNRSAPDLRLPLF